MAKICVPVCVSRLDELERAIGRANEVADIIELRLDCASKETLAEVLENYARVRTLTGRPIIVTFRPAEQGGHRAISLEERIDFWSQSGLWHDDNPQSSDFADIEAEFLINQSPMTGDWSSQLSKHRVICSHHDFAGVPADLNELYEQMTATSAAVIKIAVQANDAIDCIPICQLLERAQAEGREIIAIAMGQAGIMTRILGPARGSFLTYGSLDDEGATAPGQLTASELRQVYRIDKINRETEIFGIIGNPVSHSLSPRIHNAAFAAGERNAVYIPFEVHDAAQFIRRMAHPSSREIDWNLRGLSVTAPHKSTVIPHLDWVDAGAKEIGAVNTIVAQDDQLRGFNTDASGLMTPLLNRFGAIRDARCAVIGAGGAARAALWALINEGGMVELFARNVDRGTITAKDFGVPCHQLSGSDFAGFDIVINATPLGMSGAYQEVTPAAAAQLRGVRLAYDLVYNPIETVFLRQARAAGCDTLTGIEMLIAQGAEQFRLWTGQFPDANVMRARALRSLVQ